MPRPIRLNLANIPQHIIQRGNNRQNCFTSDDDYSVYLDKLNEYSKKFKVDVHSYVLMTNHVHFLMTPQTSNGVSQLMQSLGRYYVRYFNQTYNRTGTLWEGRFKSSLVDSENYFFIVSRYIELNPVRAGMVDNPADYPWSSYQKNALGVPIQLVEPHHCYLSLGQTNKEREYAYRGLFDEKLSKLVLKEIRDSINKAWVLGCDEFKRDVESKTGVSTFPLGHGGDRKSKKYKDNQQL